ncbi:YadA-like family protein [Providencia alcalifaciens]|jgi:hypothetical protein|uniref:YadA-like family protein n=1 Tax=Providencia TaxID=586 RepID=UPI00131F21B1|nr:YadA-like family protein [Providencia alcalifaciens]MBG5881758.1 YadA-like family protein [Providencia alcalifaciens]
MKNKLLLSALSMATLTSLSSQSLALTGFQDAINSPYDYPEHRHEDNRTTFELKNDEKLSDNINKYIDIAETMTPVVDVLAYAIETSSPLIKKLSTLNEKEPASLSPITLTNSSISANPLSSSQKNNLAHLENKIEDNNHAINLLNMSINNLSQENNKQEKNIAEKGNSIKKLQSSLSDLEKNFNDSEMKNKKYVDDEVFRSEAITTLLIDDTNKKHETDTKQLNIAIEKLDKDIRESDLITSQLIEDAEKNSKAHADLILRNQQMLNIDRFDKLDKQEKLQTQQLNQINTRVDQMESKIHQTARDANAGIASVAAMTNIPYTTNTRFSAGLGLGNFKNGNAIAAGAQYQVKQNLNLRSSISWNNSDRAVLGAGIAYGW